MTKPFYISTAISYPNGRPHIGHAYEAIAADAIARFHRLNGRDVRLVTGTDEHGLKMVQTARTAGMDTQLFADEMSSYFKAMYNILGISYDRFCRTTEPRHHQASVELWDRMRANGDLFLDRYEGWYSVRDEAFYAPDEIVDGEGGTKLSPQGTAVEWTVEETWFFRLSAYQDRLLEFFNAHPDFIQPASRRNEVRRFVESGLKDLSISRTSFDWGVKVPDSPEHVMYVWVDALTTYLTGVGFADDPSQFERYWPADLHLIGKDIMRFYTVYWPAFLMSAGLPLPKAVFGHGFILLRGEKMSKSAGNVVDPMAVIDAYGSDALRYFLLREVSFGQDGSISDEALVTRCNADLANNFGNLAQRCLSIITKNGEGKVPAGAYSDASDQTLLANIKAGRERVRAAMDRLEVTVAVEAVWQGMSDANQYFADAAPWVLRKTDPVRADSVLATTHDVIRRLAIMAQWIIPAGAAQILDLVGVAASDRSFAAMEQMVPAGTPLPPPVGVYPRLALADA